jgi:hypothetical protein
MIKSLVVRLLLPALLAVCFVLPAAPVLAAPFPFDKVNCASSAGQESAICKSTGGDPLTGSAGIIHTATKIIAGLAGAAAVIIMVLAGIRYITSDGDAEQVSRAKKTIIFSAVGLIVIILGQAIINIVLGKVV